MKRDERLEKILAFVDGSMDEDERQEFLAALARDPDLEREVEEHRDTDRALGLLEEQPATREWLGGLADAVLARAGGPDTVPDGDEALASPARPDAAPGTRPPRLLAGALALAAVLVISAVLVFRDSGEPPARPGPAGSGVPIAAAPDSTAAGGTPRPVEDAITDPDFIANFEVIQSLAQLEEWSEVLDTEHEALFFDAMTLEVLAGV
jgi:anti-sigma factor RsiW